ncbi:MAG: AMP-binding protein, partial [Sterolibacterium sp.]|nr:AMP-binding protein [Sterolibacterium sp.]
MKTLVDILIHAASATPERAVVFARRDGRDQLLTYAQLHAQARRTLAWLQAQGLRSGQRLVVQCLSDERQLVLFWACQLGGMVPVLLPRVASWRRDSAGGRKLAGVLRLLQANAACCLLIDADQAADYQDPQSLAHQALQGGRCLIDAPQAGEADQARLHTVRTGDLAYLQFSSGTVGQPKGVQLTHDNLICNIKEIADTVKAQPEESTLSWMPYYHDMGLISFHLVPLYRGMGQVKLAAADFIAEPMFWLRQIARHRAAVISSPNFGLQHVLDRLTPAMLCESGVDLSCVRLLCNGAEPISARVMWRFSDLLAPVGLRRQAMFPVYGLAEACVAVTFSPPASEPVVHRLDLCELTMAGRAVEATGSSADNAAQVVDYVDVGYPLPSVELRIADAQDRPLAERQLGEVQIRGANVTAGYLGETALNAALFTADGWLRTGDLGFLLKGRLSVTGRRKDVIFLNGRNLMAVDVERWLMERCAGLQEGSVAVCAGTAASGGEQVALFLARPRHRVTQNELLAWAQTIRQAAEDYLAHPVAAVLLLPRLPRTSSGKLQRQQLAQDWLAGRLDTHRLLPPPASGQALAGVGHGAEADAGAEPAAADLTADIRQLWAEVLGCTLDAVGLDTPFTRLGGTSVQAVEMLVRLEERLGRALGFALLIECRTINEVLAYVAGLPAQEASPPGAPQDGSPATIFSAARTRPPAARREADKIAIIGLAGRFPGGADLAAFWKLLREGRSAVAPVPAERWAGQGDPYHMAALADPDAFAAEFFGIAADEARIMDPQQRLMLELAHAALEDAGYTGQRPAGAVGVYLGASSNTYLEDIQLRRAAGEDSAALRHAQLMPANLLNLIAARIAHVLNLKGPALTIDTACSSSLVAVQQACNDLLLGHCDLALAGGVNLLTTPSAHQLLAQAGALSATGQCRAFDAAADGMVPGEGGGLVVLKPLARALADGDRIEAVIDAVAVNNDGRSIGIMAPTPEGQEAVLRLAYQRAGVSPAQMDHVEAHGTGTPIGDPIEIRALGRVFGESAAVADDDSAAAHARADGIAIGSVKTNIGHLLAAAGIAGLIKVLLALRHEWLPASLHLQRPHPRIRFEQTPFQPLRAGRPWPRGAALRRAAVSSFGFGGTNAHLVLHEGPPPPPPPAADAAAASGPWLLPLAARTADELARMRWELAEHLQAHPELPLLDVCYTRALGRASNCAAFTQRICYRVTTLAEAIEKLRQAVADRDAGLDAVEAQDEVQDEGEALRQRWLAGQNVDWRVLFEHSSARIVALPTYPHTRGRYWLTATTTSTQKAAPDGRATAAVLAPLTADAAMQRPAIPPPTSATLPQILDDVLRAAGVPQTAFEGQSFASLGVDSLLALKVSNLLQERLSLELSPSLLFEQDTPARLLRFLQEALAVDGREDALPAAATVAHAVFLPTDHPLSSAQLRLWFLEQLQRSAAAGASSADASQALYNISTAVRLRGPLAVARLEQAFNVVVQRHATLRSRFLLRDGEPRQQIQAAADCRLDLPLDDLGALTAAERTAEIARLARVQARQSFDLGQAPLMRARLLRIEDDEHVLLLDLHHLIADGWSLRVLLEEVAVCYAAQADLSAALPPLPLQYVDHVRRQQVQQASNARRQQAALAYWCSQLQDAPALLNLPLDHPRPAVRGTSGARLYFQLPAGLIQDLRDLARRTDATLYMVLLAAFQLLLARYSGQQTICVGTPVANRQCAEDEKLIGLFVNTLVMRSQLSPALRFADLLAQVRTTVLAGFAQQTLPFERLVEALQPDRKLAHSPLFQAMFVLQRLPSQALAALDLHFELMNIDPGLSQFDLTLSIDDVDVQAMQGARADGLNGFFEYSTALFKTATIERMAGHFKQLLAAIVAQPALRLADINLLTAEERQLLAHWNDTGGVQPASALASFPQRFAGWATRQPQALAVSFVASDAHGGPDHASSTLTYGALDARSNQLAHHLRATLPTLGADSIVAVCIERSPQLVVALLGVLKAGAAYLPIDPTQPVERINWMLQDARPCAVIGPQSAGGDGSAQRIDMEADWPVIASQPETALVETENVHPGQLAYVIYTSGSTGRPKGVLLEHRGLSNLVQWQ